VLTVLRLVQGTETDPHPQQRRQENHVMTAPAKPASNGSTRRISATTSRDGLAKLRREETRALISMVCEAMYQTSNVASELHTFIYAKDSKVRPDRIRRLLAEARTCWQTADQYLRMLGSVPVDYDPADEPPF
jgi:hypothetical protein